MQWTMYIRWNVNGYTIRYSILKKKKNNTNNLKSPSLCLFLFLSFAIIFNPSDLFYIM